MRRFTLQTTISICAVILAFLANAKADPSPTEAQPTIAELAEAIVGGWESTKIVGTKKQKDLFGVTEDENDRLIVNFRADGLSVWLRFTDGEGRFENGECLMHSSRYRIGRNTISFHRGEDRVFRYTISNGALTMKSIPNGLTVTLKKQQKSNKAREDKRADHRP